MKMSLVSCFLCLNKITELYKQKKYTHNFNVLNMNKLMLISVKILKTHTYVLLKLIFNVSVFYIKIF